MDIDAAAVADFYTNRLKSMCLDRLNADASVNDTADSNPLADKLCPGDCSGSGTCSAGRIFCGGRVLFKSDTF